MDVQADLHLLLGVDKDIQWRSSALFLLKLKEHRRISQAAIDDVVEDRDVLFSHSVQRFMQEFVKSWLLLALRSVP